MEPAKSEVSWPVPNISNGKHYELQHCLPEKVFISACNSQSKPSKIHIFRKFS